jgi:hypothetical protein
LDKDLSDKTEKKMIELQRQSGMSWQEVQYVNAAATSLQTCRYALMWTYAFAFYLSPDHQTTIFEENQKDLEYNVEALSEMFEKPVTELSEPDVKAKMKDKTAYCNRRRVALFDHAAINLQNGMRILFLLTHASMVEYVIANRYISQEHGSSMSSSQQTAADVDQVPPVTIKFHLCAGLLHFLWAWR